MKDLPSPVAKLLYAISVSPGFGDPNGGMRRGGAWRQEGKTISPVRFFWWRATATASAIAAAACHWHWSGNGSRLGVPVAGVTPCVGLLAWDEERAELSGHDIVLVRT